VHLTLLKPAGSGKADVEPNKLTVGPSRGWPIVLAPPNDLLGMAITEGIEDGSSVVQATSCSGLVARLGVWAAGGAGRMPRLADVVPSYIEVVTIYAHADPAGQRGADELARRLIQRAVEVLIEGLSQ
jgi:hypothetical protein